MLVLRPHYGISATGFAMSFVHVLFIVFALALCAGPVLLLRRPEQRGLAGGAGEPAVPIAITRNAWIAYALRVSVFVPLFALGAAGDVWPAIVGAIGFGAGVYLLGVSRRQVIAFVDEASGRGRPATLHAFVAQACGDAATVRLAVAAASVVALLGLAGAEAAALVSVLTPLIGGGLGVPCFVMLVVGAGLYAVWAGTTRVRYASQALLGAIYLGIFGSAAFLLYLNASDLHPMPPHGAFALVALTACCVAILSYRQTKYVETPLLVAPGDTSRWRRAVATPVRVLLRFANVAISVFAVLVVVIAGMEFYFLGLSGTIREGLAALGTAPHIPAVGLAGIATLALAYPLVDAVSWQSANAFVHSARAAGVEADATPTFFQRPMRMIAGETVLIGILFAAFGAIAALSTDLPPDDLGMPAFIGQLILFDNGITDAASTLLLVGIFAMAMATMGMAIATAMTAIRLDILPAWRGSGDDADAPSGDRTPLVVVSTIGLVIAAIWIVSGVPSAGVADARFFAMALAFACLQVSLLPLLLARLRGVALPAGAALTVLGGAVAAPVCCVAIYTATTDVLWLWLAVPACLVCGLLLLAGAALRGGATTPPG